MDQRQNSRVCVQYPGSFSGPPLRAPGTILDLSIAGCRAHVPFGIKKDECLWILIDVPKYEHPIYVVSAQVRWSNGQEFGVEFTHIETEDRQRLAETLREIETSNENAPE